MQIKILLLVAFCALLGATGQLFFKLASQSLEFELISLITNWKLFLGLFFYGIATILFVFALKHGNLSLLYPVIATSYIWVAVFSTVFLNESFPPLKWVGILLIIVGVGVISR
ncbi:MAG: EamA family transporter [Nanobdellota archaeon]